jgi:hypothetical protein
MDEQKTAGGADRSQAQVALTGVVQLTSGAVPALSAGRVVFLESAEHLGYAQRVRGQDGLVFSPGTETTAKGVLTYEGALSTPGDEFLVADDLFVYTQDYLATPFLAVAGPTIVRIDSEQDYAGFLQDADLARDKGVFVEQLLHSGVFLADQCALGTTHPCIGSARLHVSESGEIRTAPGGRALGTVDSDPNDVLRAADTPAGTGDVCLNAAVDAQTMDAARAPRPWLSRYLRAIDVLRGLRVNGLSGYRVSGFGGRLSATLPSELTEHTDAPLLLWNDDERLICDSAGERVFRLGSDAAKIVELLLITSSAEGARDLAATRLGLDRDTACAAIDVITAEFTGTGILPSGVPA